MLGFVWNTFLLGKIELVCSISEIHVSCRPVGAATVFHWQQYWTKMIPVYGTVRKPAKHKTNVSLEKNDEV